MSNLFKFYLLGIGASFYCLPCTAQNVYRDLIETAGWQTAGSREINHTDTVYLSPPQDTSDYSSYLNTEIQNAPTGSVLLLSKGNHYITQPIYLKSNITLVGGIDNSTTLNFSLEKNSSLIIAQGKESEQSKKISNTLEQSKKNLELSITAPSDKGKIIKIIEDDAGRIHSEWAQNSIGQLFSFNKLNNNTIVLNEAISFWFKKENQPRYNFISPIENVKICNLTIKNTKEQKPLVSNLHFINAYNCIIDNITSSKANYAHITLEQCLKVTVQNCDISEAHDYGKGGNGYGVVLQKTTTNCKISNSRFHKLRHSILFQWAANGNVIFENHSYEPYWTGTLLPKDASGDIVFHGNYPYANLVDNNICQHVVMDHSHGLNGLGNHIFRNEIHGYGIYISKRGVKNGDQSIIGNALNSDKCLQGKLRVNENKNYVECNYNRDKPDCLNTHPKSLYRP